ncbi:hypothetical protein GTA08_BOTSDO04678 [Neofusicoccum parvum]|uniref:Uncharacterized protein n=1 Tax=Neofusicoccum parvum TaxID=310453 RepID=A0ACB5RV76_9PEZI|nr:hypothetical protein GTA08_BOTSDO04678 [Neofusicoccum parvum]
MDHWPPFDMDPDFLEFANELSLNAPNSFYGEDENIKHQTAPMDPNLGFKLPDHPVPVDSNTNMFASGTPNTPRESLFTATTNNLFNYQHPSGPISMPGFGNAVIAAPWTSAPFGAGPSILPSASDLANTWATPFDALEAHVSTNHLPDSGLGASNALARPGIAYANASPRLDGPIPSFHEKRDGKYHCLMQPCPRPTFSRLADLQRHQNACHLGTAAFWCASTGCDRSQTHPYGRAFPRKDKRNDHEKKVHGRVLSVN